MTKSLYNLLNKSAKSWWYYKKLRDNGRTIEARSLERESIKSSIKTIRSAVLMSVGRGGWTVYCDSGSIVSGYGNCDSYIYGLKLMGVPIIDTRSISDDKISSVVLKAPLPSYTKGQIDPPPYGPFDYCPIEYYVKYYTTNGATLV